MELRHLRYFVAVAEELHFGRAAERLHIEQSPLSRAIKELEFYVSAQLFERDKRGTRLTWAGQVLLEDVRRIFAVLDQAKANVKAAASGYRGTLRIALSDGIVPQRLATLLAFSREQEPDVEIRLFEVALSQQIKGLRNDLYDAGFSRSDDVGESIVAEQVWADPLVLVMPARHPLLTYKRVPLEEVLRYPLVLCRPDIYEGWYRQIKRMIHAVEEGKEPTVAEHVATFGVMMALVSAGYGLGFACEDQVKACQQSEIVSRPLAGASQQLITYLLRPGGNVSDQLGRFIKRVSVKAA